MQLGDELDKLTKVKLDGALYLTLLEGKSQSDATRFIYNTKDLKKVNQKPIIDARRRLIKSKYVKTIDSIYRINNPTLLSTPLPIVEYIQYRLMEHSKLSKSKTAEDYRLTEDEEKALYRILDSKWFRSFFKKDKLINYGYMDEDRFIVHNSMNSITDILDDIASIGFSFLYRRQDIAKRMPDLKDFDLNADFDTFANKWVNDKLKTYNEFVKGVIKKGEDYYTESSGKRLLLYAENLYCFCFPKSLYQKLVRIGRIELTLIIGLEQGIFTYKKKP